MPLDYKSEEVRKIVKNRWRDQGIWSNKWTEQTRWNWRWKHELPLDPSSDSEAEAVRPSIFGPDPARIRPQKSARREHEKRAVKACREREREASRPIHRFFHQVLLEHERMQQGPDALDPSPKDANSKAYENVKKSWVEQNIWDERWGLLPGMSWMHEEPLDRFLDYYAPRPIFPATNGDHEAKAEPRQVHRPSKSIFAPRSPDPQALADPETSSAARVNTKATPQVSQAAQTLQPTAAHTNHEAQPLLHAATQTDPPQPSESPQLESSTVAKRLRGRPKRRDGVQAAMEAPGNTAAEAPNGTAPARRRKARAATTAPRRSARVAKQETAVNSTTAEVASGTGSRPKRKATEETSRASKRPNRQARP